MTGAGLSENANLVRDRGLTIRDRPHGLFGVSVLLHGASKRLTDYLTNILTSVGLRDLPGGGLAARRAAFRPETRSERPCPAS
jgi:hypothetical protein